MTEQAQQMLDRQKRHIDACDENAYVEPEEIVQFIGSIAPIVRKSQSRYRHNRLVAIELRRLLALCADLPIFIGEELETLAIEVTASSLTRASVQLIELALQADVLRWQCSCETILAHRCSIASTLKEPPCPSERCAQRLDSLNKERLDQLLLLLLARQDRRINRDLQCFLLAFDACPLAQYIGQRAATFSLAFARLHLNILAAESAEQSDHTDNNRLARNHDDKRPGKRSAATIVNSSSRRSKKTRLL